MAPIKFEEGIKDKIEQRVLQPSPDAWKKLSDSLDNEPKKNNRKPYWWLGIAASFVGLLVMFSIIFSKDSEKTIDPQIIVNEETTEDIQIEKDLLKASQLVIEEPKEEDAGLERQIVKTEIVKADKKEATIKMSDKQIEKESTEAVVYQETIITNAEVLVKSPEDLKVAEVVDKIQKLQETKATVSDAEIDALLDQAQKELMSQRLYDASTKTVDAELLLLQVETDLDQSFRDRVFEALKSGYKKVKTAVAERNQ